MYGGIYNSTHLLMELVGKGGGGGKRTYRWGGIGKYINDV